MLLVLGCESETESEITPFKLLCLFSINFLTDNWLI